MAAAASIPLVYAELRRMVGENAPSVDLLHFARSAIGFYLISQRRRRDGEFLEPPEYSLERSAFETWPVDAAMSDGGWMVMEYELDQARPEIEIGRVHVYQPAAIDGVRIYAAESELVPYEGDRVFRSMEWLVDSQIDAQRIQLARARDDENHSDME